MESLDFDLIKRAIIIECHAAGITPTVTGKVCGFVTTAHGHDLFKGWQ